MNPSLTRFPSCLNYLMEDRIEAHKLSGMKTAQMLTGLCWSLSRPELLSGPLISRQFLNVSDNIISRGNSKKHHVSRNDHHNNINSVSGNIHSHHTHYLAASTKQKKNVVSSSHVSLMSTSPPITVMQWNVLSQGMSFMFCDVKLICMLISLLPKTFFRA